MNLENPFTATSIFIGDGLSDRFAAQTADIVFTKKKLSEFCLANGIPQTTYCSLKQIAESLDYALEDFFLSQDGRRRSWLEAA